MARMLKHKELVNTRLATNYGGWMYCDSCGKNIGYLCYVTYDSLTLEYVCQCGSKGSAFLDFTDSVEGQSSKDDFITIKNRLCCPHDESPLITILSKNLKTYQFDITCKSCGKRYTKKSECHD